MITFFEIYRIMGLIIWDNLKKSGQFFLKEDARSDRHDLYTRKKLFFAVIIYKDFLLPKHGKSIKNIKTKVFPTYSWSQKKRKTFNLNL